MSHYGWQWALCWFFGGIAVGCFVLVCWHDRRRSKALNILREDILKDNPAAFKGNRDANQ